jgi:uncharacterized protein (DUF302 family)
MSVEGVITRESQSGPAETVARLVAGIEARGLTLFARIDHAAGAATAGLELRPTVLLIFGNARGGTPLMQAQQLLGLELPLRVLIWQDEALRTWISCPDLEWLGKRYALTPGVGATVTALAAALEALVTRAINPGADELDEELDDTFPASDPLPWSHDTR